MEQSITSLFEQQVAKYPNRIAVKTRREALTYDALNVAATRVARAILDRSEDGDEAVALLFGQTSGAVAATLGVLKAGRAYVALDPSYPPARLIDILKDSKTGLIVTDSTKLSLAKELAESRPVLSVDELDPLRSTAGPTIANSARTLASIIYTSGSTGKPKGVIQDHRSILHRVMMDTNNFHFCPDDRLSLLSPPTYSVSLRNLFGALLNGAMVCPFDIEEEGLSRLSQWLLEECVTVYASTPTVFRHFAGTLAGKEQFTDLRLIDLAGEATLKSDVELYKRHFSPVCILVNTLGCNEAGVFRRYFIDHETEIEGNVVPAGYEVADKEILLLGDGLELEAHQVGEIAIRSSYLSRGYWDRPDLTDAVFVPDPAGGDRQLYLTGDRGEMLPDGCLIYRGRKDTRIKIRGQAVELSELEIALVQHEGVKEAAVKPLGQSDHQTRLVAFVVPSQESTLTNRELRRFLAQKLPAFMVPSKLVFVSSLPRLPNGKVDRQALALPDEITWADGPEIQRSNGPKYVAPVETIEHQLVQIWEELLGVHPISVQDNFFDLGGDSLLAVQMMDQVQLCCGEAVPVSALLGGATLGALAQTLVERRTHGRDSLVARVQSGGPEWPVFFLHGDFRGGGFYCLSLARALGQDQRFYALTSHGLNGDPVPPTIEAMAASYIEMIQGVEPEGPYLLGGLCHGGLIAFEMARQLKRKGQKVDLVAMIGPPAWNPPHWRFVQDTIATIVRLCGGDPDRATDIFLALRDRRVRWREFCHYSALWLRGAANISLTGRVARTLRLAKRVVSGELVSEKPWAEPSFPAPPGDHLMSAYRRAVASYVRRPYSGRIAIFWPNEVPVNTLGGPQLQWRSASDPSLGWRRVAPDVEVHPVPGDYTTSITTHVQVLADRMKESVKTARSNRRTDS